MKRKIQWYERINEQGDRYVRIPLKSIAIKFKFPIKYDCWVYSHVSCCDKYVHFCYVDDSWDSDIDTLYFNHNWQYKDETWIRDIMIPIPKFCNIMGIDSELIYHIKCSEGMLHLYTGYDEGEFDMYIAEKKPKKKTKIKVSKKHSSKKSRVRHKIISTK